jgi:hypothetical protein
LELELHGCRPPVTPKGAQKPQPTTITTTTTGTTTRRIAGPCSVTPQGVQKPQPSATIGRCIVGPWRPGPSPGSPANSATGTGTGTIGPSPYRQGVHQLVIGHQQAQGGAHRQTEPPPTNRLQTGYTNSKHAQSET